MSKSPQYQWKLVTDPELIQKATIALARIKDGDIDKKIFMFPLFDCIAELEERLKIATNEVILNLLDGAVVSSKKIDGYNKSLRAEYEDQRGRSLTTPGYPATKYASDGLGFNTEKFIVWQLERLGLKGTSNLKIISPDMNQRPALFAEQSTLEKAGYQISPRGVYARLPTLDRK
ncbi:MAG: hypothetical protein AAF244_01490 [Pseudomonadota bacterium]